MFGRDSEAVHTALGCVACAGESSGIASTFLRVPRFTITAVFQ